MASKLGYFVSGNAKYGFIGGVGGPRETEDRSELYNRMCGILRPATGRSTAKPTNKGVESEQGLKEGWKTVVDTQQEVVEPWSSNHRWWTLAECMAVYVSYEY